MPHGPRVRARPASTCCQPMLGQIVGTGPLQPQALRKHDPSKPQSKFLKPSWHPKPVLCLPVRALGGASALQDADFSIVFSHHARLAI